MRHGVKGRKLGRTSSHREALFRNQLQSLIENERIVTTLPKAKELRPLAERLITRGKQGTVTARRWVLRWIPNTEKSRSVVKKVFDEIAPRFESRPGGYCRIIKLGPRQGDGAEMAVLEFVDREGAPAAAEEKKGKQGAAAKDAKVRKKDAQAKKEPALAAKKPAAKAAPKKKAEAGPKPAPKKSSRKKGEEEEA